MSTVVKINKGGRKTAVARLHVLPGDWSFFVNKRKLEDYFPSEMFRAGIVKPLEALGIERTFSIKANVSGGGLRGQSDAIRLALSKYLADLSPENKLALKSAGLLTRDPRSVERKKYGQKKARKKFQFTKR